VSSQASIVVNENADPLAAFRLRVCPACGYSLRGLTALTHCPECGFECEGGLAVRPLLHDMSIVVCVAVVILVLALTTYYVLDRDFMRAAIRLVLGGLAIWGVLRARIRHGVPRDGRILVFTEQSAYRVFYRRLAPVPWSSIANLDVVQNPIRPRMTSRGAVHVCELTVVRDMGESMLGDMKRPILETTRFRATSEEARALRAELLRRRDEYRV
jgi:hypothetical protein